jgi:hypothetical protein
VLAGSFHDDAGDYPDDTYVRNPIGTAYERWAGPDGAMFSVKLHRFAAADTQRVVIDIRSGARGATVWPDRAAAPRAQLRARRAGAVGTVDHVHAASALGRRGDPRARYPKGSWISSPHLSAHNPFTVDPRRADLRQNRPPHPGVIDRRLARWRLSSPSASPWISEVLQQRQRSAVKGSAC